MKESSTELPKKKLIQARLPFQILSPGAKSPASTPGETRKRKTHVEDVLSDEITDLKENQDAPVEKKPKFVISDGEEKTDNEKSIEINKNVEKEEEEMEIDNKVNSERPKSTDTKTPMNKKYKTNITNSSKKSRTPRQKTSNTNNNINSFLKKNIHTDDMKSAIVDVIDLCDSPSKPSDKEISTQEKDEAKINLTSSLDSTNKEVYKENESYQKCTDESSQKLKIQDSNNSVPLEKNGTCGKSLVAEQCLSVDDKDKEQLVNAAIGNENLNNKSLVRTNENKHSVCDETDVGTEQLQISPSAVAITSSELNIPKSCSTEETNVHENKNNVPNIESPNGDEQPTIRPLEENTPTTSKSINNSVLKTPSAVNESATSCDVSFSSESSTPTATPDTPRVTKKKVSIRRRRLTPHQLLERERLKMEKMETKQKKAEEKEQKRKLKLEKYEEKKRQKLEREEERKKEKEEKDKKKQAEIDQKNEEKRIKKEEQQAKEEEKRKKEEEEKKKKEEKRLKDEQKESEKRKSAQAFASFFLKSETKPTEEEVVVCSPQELNFQPFEVKNDMRLAPLVRSQLTQDRRKLLDSLLSGGQDQRAHTLYIDEIREPLFTKGTSDKTWPAPDDSEDDVIFIESERPNEEMEVDKAENDKKTEKKFHRAKLIQFHENRRPPYWGTWRKKSNFIRPRAPLNEDKTMLEYDVDSDDEWEEPEDGESLRGSDDDESQDEQYEEDNDMFVPHGYLSDEEGQDDLDDKSPEAMKAKLKFLQMEFEAERNEKQERLKPRLIGCVWLCNSDSDPSAVGSHIAELFLSRRAVWEGLLPLQITPPAPATPTTPPDMADSEDTKDNRGPKRKIVPDTMMPMVIRAVHGSKLKLSKLLSTLQQSCEADCKPSIRCLEEKIKEIALWTKSDNCWFVKEEAREAHNLMDLKISPPSTPCTPIKPISSITKFTKVLTSEERRKLLSAQKESSKQSTTPSSCQPPACKSTPSPQLPTSAKPSLAAKKKVLFTTLGPVQSANSIRHFVAVMSKGDSKAPTNQMDEQMKKQERPVKRITPITLATTVTKPHPPSDDDCVIVSE